MLSFDLISDLYVDEWPNTLNWKGLGTSLVAVVAGDISSDVDQTIWELKRISASYKQTIYIEGDLEHKQTGWATPEIQTYLKAKISKIPYCIYLHDNVVIFNDLAFIGANLWWIPQISSHGDWEEFINTLKHHNVDLEYLKASVSRMQRAADVNQVCLISHTIPNLELLSYTNNNMKIGSHVSEDILAADTKNKVRTWCFGSTYEPLDYTVSEVRYISNPRGTPTESLKQIYFPLKVEI